MRKKILALVLVLSMILVGCSSKNNVDTSNKEKSVNNTKKLNVVASFFPLYDLVKKVGGDKINAVNLTQTGSGHGYEPSIDDMAKIVKSDLLLINGAGFESWIERIKDEKINTLTMGEHIDLIKIKDVHEHSNDKDDHEEDHSHGDHDPHLWLSPKNLKKMLELIKDKLIEIDQKNKEYYIENFNKYNKEFDILIGEYDKELSKYNGKEIVVPHEAFNYLFKPYNIRQIAMAGINSTDDPNTGRMAEITKLLKEKNIKTVFYEYGQSDKIAKTIASEINGNVKALSTMEVIGEKDLKEGEDLISIMRMNLKNIVDSFEGK